MQVSPNFNLQEITKGKEVSLYANYLAVLLIQDILQPVRTKYGRPMRIRSGVRTLSDLFRLREQGYYPSETSDHFFGEAIPLESKRKKKLYGDYYVTSVGAVDIQVDGGEEEAKKL